MTKRANFLLIISDQWSTRAVDNSVNDDSCIQAVPVLIGSTQAPTVRMVFENGDD
jgi:hypothetical protein